jgi:hypothetical protein
MNREEQLRSFTDEELLEEINRRVEESRKRMQALTRGLGEPGKFFAKAQAKARYWAPWHEYRAAHPDATVAEWRRAQKRSSKK